MATNTTATSTTHTGNGSTNNFAISFSFLANAEIDVTVAGVLKTLDTHYTISGSTVTFTSGNTPANGAAIKFQRDTDISAKKVDFQDGSVLTETDLDTNSDQVLFAQQEITDKLGTIEEGATGDQTAAEIRALVESATDSNVFTDADHTKLNSVESNATADQTAAEIRTLVESASDSNVFTDADHTKLNSVESGATADQTNAEIRAAVEAATDSNVFTDADHTKLNSVETGATADQTVSEIKGLIAGSPLDSSHLAANSVGDSELASTQLTTLAGMQSGTASKLADNTALTADLADLNQLDGMAKQTSITDDDTKFPTSGAIVDYVAAQLAPIGGFEVIATDAAFPNTQPASGVVISIADGGGLVVNGSGTSTTGRTVNGTTVTINNFASNFNNSTVDAGVAILVSSTGSNQVYNYHKATLKEADLLSLSGDINDFGERYRVVNGEPTSNNDEGDLIYDKNADAIKVFDSSTNTFKLINTIGEFKFLFLCPTGGSGAPTFDGNTSTYDLRVGSNNGSAATVTNAAQLIVSIDGVIQKPNTGTSQPSEGFAMVDSNTIVFGSNLEAGVEVFISQIGDEVNIGTPHDDTVSTAKLQNLAVTEAKLGNSAVTRTKLNLVSTSSAAGLEVKGDGSSDGYLQLNCSQNSHGVKIKSPPHSASQSYTLTLPSNIVNGQFLTTDANGNLSWAAVTSIGGATGVDFNDNVKARFGTGNDLSMYHDGNGSYLLHTGTGFFLIEGNGTNNLNIRAKSGESSITCIPDGGVELFHNNVKKFETTSTGIKATGNILANLSSALNTQAGSIQAAGPIIAKSYINAHTSNATVLEYVSNVSKIRAYGATSGSGQLAFNVGGGGDAADFEAMRITNAGHVRIPTDNKQLQLGASQDLLLYHTGFHSYLRNLTGNLYIQGNNSGSATNNVVCLNDGTTELHYDSSKKLETLSDGINVTGTLKVNGSAISTGGLGNVVEDTSPQLGGDLQSNGNDIDFADNDKAHFGTGNDLEIYHSGNNCFFLNDTGYTRFAAIYGALYLDGNNINFRSGDGNETLARFIDNGAAELYYDNSKKFETTSSGITVSGNAIATGNMQVNDNKYLYAGNSGDLQLYHTGSHSYIKNKTGNLYIMANDADVGIHITPNNSVAIRYDDVNKIQTGIGGEYGSFRAENGAGGWDGMAVGNSNIVFMGSQNDAGIWNDADNEWMLKCSRNGHTRLYYDGSEKVKTESWGVQINGEINCSSHINLGDNDRLNVGGSQDIQIVHDGTNSFIKNTTGNLYINAKSTETAIQITPDDDVRLRYDNSNKLYTASYGIQVGSAGGSAFSGLSNYQAYVGFDTHSSSSFGGIVMGAGPNGNSPYIAASKAGNGTGLNLGLRTNGSVRLLIQNNGNIGAPSGSNIYYASDQRLKKNVTLLDKGLEAIKALRPVSFNWVDGFCDVEKDPLYGFIAQEVQTVDSNLVSPFGDDVELGNDQVVTDPLRVNEKFIIPMLVKAMQELSAKVETLETKVATLEGA